MYKKAIAASADRAEKICFPDTDFKSIDCNRGPLKINQPIRSSNLPVQSIQAYSQEINEHHFVSCSIYTPVERLTTILHLIKMTVFYVLIVYATLLNPSSARSLFFCKRVTNELH
jgi:hypothetical protein